MNYTSPIRTNGLAFKHRRQKQLISKLKLDAIKHNEVNLEQKLKIRTLSEAIESLLTQMKKSGIEPERELSEIESAAELPTPKFEKLDDCHNEKLQELVIENEALRKGLHEVLSSIQEQQGSTTIEIKSQVLERLIKILDVRNVAGWYTPAMRLQAELHSLQGGYAELREQLKYAR